MNPQIEQAARILEIKKAFDSSVAEMASAFSAAVSGDGITKESAEEWFKINLDSILEIHRKSERAALGVPRYVVILSDSAGATGALPFRDRTDFTNWLEDKPFKISEIKGYGNLQEVDNRLVAVFSDSVAFIHPKYEDILEGRSQDMSRPADSWKTASGGITSYIEALAPEKWKTIINMNKPDSNWLRHHRNCNEDWIEEVFSYEKDMCRIISQMKDNIARVHVPGFIRQQAYGKQWSEHRTIWVDGFERGQWIRDGVIIRRVTK